MFVAIMPLAHMTILHNGLRLAIWEFVDNQLSPLEKWLAETLFAQDVQSVKLPKRKREILGTKLLKRTLGIPSLSYQSSGKPISQSGHVSISHSDNLVGLVQADFLVGLDLQLPSDKLYRVRFKFCNSQELLWAKKSDNELLALTLIWSTKEAVYKMFGKNISFSKDMSVNIIDDKTMRCRVKCDEVDDVILLRYFWFKNQCVVYRIL